MQWIVTPRFSNEVYILENFIRTTFQLNKISLFKFIKDHFDYPIVMKGAKRRSNIADGSSGGSMIILIIFTTEIKCGCSRRQTSHAKINQYEHLSTLSFYVKFSPTLLATTKRISSCKWLKTKMLLFLLIVPNLSEMVNDESICF